MKPSVPAIDLLRGGFNLILGELYAIGLESGIWLGLEESRQFYFIQSYLIQILFHLDFISSKFYFI